MIDKDFFQKTAEKHDFSLTQTQLTQFATYATLLVDYNEKVNLTAITDPEGIAVKHFLDSMLLAKVHDFENNPHTLVDVGTGAGFPGVVMAILYPSLPVTLLDSLNKRIVFLQTLAKELALTNITCVHMRAEDAGHNPDFREKFTVATARAVANLPTLCEYCMPLVRKGGTFVALKGSDGAKELENSKKAIHLLGGKFVKINNFTLEDAGERTLISIEKISQTATKYPRNPKKMKENPL